MNTNTNNDNNDNNDNKKKKVKYNKQKMQVPSGVEPSGVEPSGVEPSGVEPSGVEPSGVEPSGVEPSGVEPSGVEPSGVEPIGVEPSGVEPSQKIPKKRGRKPKGGTIITSIENKNVPIEQVQNIILHLKCNINELQTNVQQEITTFQFKNNKSCDLTFMQINSSTNSTNSTDSNNANNSNTNINTSINPDINPKNDSSINQNNNETKEINETKLILQKLEKLSFQLHIDKIYNKKSNCFYCTCEFDNNPIYIPKFQLNKLFHVYGCFCTPECACAHLMNDNNLDTATRFERYYLLNYIYGKIYNYEKNIKPAPSPFYLLDKYYGNLSIQEYRKLLKSERLLLIVDKPLVRSMPELHNDSDDYLLNNKGVTAAIAKYTPQKQDNIINKNYILNQNFNIKS
jgi:hypothetical protein